MIAYLDTPLGLLKLSSHHDKIISIEYIDQIHANKEETCHVLSEAINQLTHYFHGELTKFELPLAPQGTDFQLKVWKLLQAIPYGKTISYSELAMQMGDPKCLRAAARANGSNPLPIVIPCHRVIGSKGDLVGYSGGLAKKSWLLTHEKADVMSQMNLFDK